MEKNIEQLLTEKLNYLENLLDIAMEQKNLIAKKDFSRLYEKDVKKHELLTKILENDEFLESNKIKNNKDFNTTQDIIKKINLALNKLIIIEKENALKLTDLNLLLSGNHIEFYKNIIK